MVRYARKQVGDRYRRGATGPNAWDCSGLTMVSYRRAGLRLPHSSHAQGRRGVRIPKANRRPGDLLYWTQGHVAVYVGRGRMVDAGNRRVGVSERRIYGNPQYRRIVNG